MDPMFQQDRSPVVDSSKQANQSRSTRATDSASLINIKTLIDAQEFHAAKSLLADYMATNDEHPMAVFWMGQVLRGTGDLKGAATCFQQVAKNWNDPIAMFELAHAQTDLAQVKDAIQSYQSCLTLFKDHPDYLFSIHKELGNLFLKSGQVDQAEAHYQLAYQINSSSVALLVNLGTLEVQKGLWNKALHWYRKASRQDSHNDRAWIGLALVHRQFGDHELSWANIERALDLNSVNPTALKLAIQWAFQDHKTARIVSRLETYMSWHQDDTDMGRLLAQVYFDSGQYINAATELERLLLNQPTDELSLELLRQVEEQMQKEWGESSEC
ncbi:MAG: hypothetical protein CL675_04910 [Bdellovibrionaceae bacterium]|nr:hypothetical protein [Pseudobdellovibrionaceae bacterium]